MYMIAHVMCRSQIFPSGSFYNIPCVLFWRRLIQMAYLQLNIPSHLYLALWTFLSLWLNYYPLWKEALPIKLVSTTNLYYGCKHKYSESSLTTWPFYKTVTVCAPSLASSLTSHGIFYQDYSTRNKISFCGSGIISNQKTLSYTIRIIPLIHL